MIIEIIATPYREIKNKKSRNFTLGLFRLSGEVQIQIIARTICPVLLPERLRPGKSLDAFAKALPRRVHLRRPVQRPELSRVFIAHISPMDFSSKGNTINLQKQYSTTDPQCIPFWAVYIVYTIPIHSENSQFNALTLEIAALPKK